MSSARPPLAAAVLVAIALGTGCVSGPGSIEGQGPAPHAASHAAPAGSPVRADQRLIEAAIATLEEEGALEPRQLEPLCRTLAQLTRRADAREAALARAVARGTVERIAKRREWGAPFTAQSEQLRLAVRAAALAPDLLDATDLAPFAAELMQQKDPRDVETFLERWTELGLPRTAAASDAIVRALSDRFPLDGLLESLFARGFRLEDAALKAYAERALAARYDAQDVLFVLERTGATGLAARLPAFAERLLAWVEARTERDEHDGSHDGSLARRIFHNAVLALAAAERAQVTLPAALFERYLRPAAARDDLDIDDVATAFALYARRTDELLERRLDALRAARATPESVTELVQVAALLLESGHARADDALLLARRSLERPGGIDEPIGARTPAPRRYDPGAVGRLFDRITPSLAAAHRGRLYLDLVTSLAREQGEPAIAARLEGVRLVRR